MFYATRCRCAPCSSRRRHGHALWRRDIQRKVIKGQWSMILPFPTISHIFRDSYGSHMGIVWGLIFPGWWFQISCFHPYLGKWFPIWLVFSDRLKPPTGQWFCPHILGRYPGHFPKKNTILKKFRNINCWWNVWDIFPRVCGIMKLPNLGGIKLDANVW